METKYNPSEAHYVVATAIVHKSGRFLIVRRSQKEKISPGKWTVPGGKLDIADYINKPQDGSNQWYNALENLVAREVNEETGLSIKNIRYLTSLTFIRPVDNIPVVVASFYADCEKDNVTLSDELTEFAWVTPQEARKYDLIDGIREEIELVSDRLSGVMNTKWHEKRD